MQNDASLLLNLSLDLQNPRRVINPLQLLLMLFSLGGMGGTVFL